MGVAYLSSVVGCMKGIMNHRPGLDMLIDDVNAFKSVCGLLSSGNSLTTRLVWELMAVLCVYDEKGCNHLLNLISMKSTVART